jgi:hypothetical protein
MLKNFIRKTANEILEVRNEKKGGDKANFQYFNDIEIIVKKGDKVIEKHKNDK